MNTPSSPDAQDPRVPQSIQDVPATFPYQPASFGPYALTRELGPAEWFWGGEPDPWRAGAGGNAAPTSTGGKDQTVQRSPVGAGSHAMATTLARPASRPDHRAESGSRSGSGIFDAVAILKSAFGFDKPDPSASPEGEAMRRREALSPSTADGSRGVLRPILVHEGRLSGNLPLRFAALHHDRQTSHIAYRFGPISDPAEREWLRSAANLAGLRRHPHVLRIERSLVDPAGHVWILTPFVGDVDGLRTLGRLLAEKRGQMPPMEVHRVMEQLLDVLSCAHRPPAKSQEPIDIAALVQGTPPHHHGPLQLEQILVDRHGCLLVELFGLARLLQPGLGRSAAAPLKTVLDEHSGQHDAQADPAMVRLEVRSVIQIGYQLLTGLRAEQPLIPAGRLVSKLDSRWDQWLHTGLDPVGGYADADAARAALPSFLPAR